MNKYLVIILILFSGYSFSQNYEIRAGIGFGGPLPTEMQDSTSGNPGIGPHFSFYKYFKLNDNWTIKTGVGFSNKKVEYGQLFSKDTLVPLPDDEDIMIPTYYKALVTGKMSLNYIDYFFLVKYYSGKWLNVTTGFYTSFLSGGYDKGNVEVIIGEGGFFDKYTDEYNNFDKLRVVDLGFSLGADYLITKKLSLGFQINRSVLNLYRKNAAPDNSLSTPKLYHTYVNLLLIYSI